MFTYDSVGTQDGSLILTSIKKQVSVRFAWRRIIDKLIVDSLKSTRGLCGEDLINSPIYRDVAQFGRARALGA